MPSAMDNSSDENNGIGGNGENDPITYSYASHTDTTESPSNPITEVVGAAIIKDHMILCAQRGEGKSLAGYWEFPGGKIEPHETAREALHREIAEELVCEVEVGSDLCATVQIYDFATIRLTTFICHLVSGTPRRTEHKQFRWMTPSGLKQLEWAPADCEAVALLSAMDFRDLENFSSLNFSSLQDARVTKNSCNTEGNAHE